MSETQIVVKNYVPENFKKKLENTQAPDISIQDIEYIENGTICVNPADVSGAVYNQNGALCKSSITYRYSGNCDIPHYAKTDNFINEDVIFMGCGYIFYHFGHFLLEGLSRTYPLLNEQFKNKKCVFVVKRGTKKLPSYVLEILGGLGILPDNIILIDKTTRFAGVYVPPQSSVISRYIANVMHDVLNTISTNLYNPNIKTYDKIYLSRSKMNDGRTYGEVAIEKIFENNGYKIIWPETLSIKDQITLVHNCRVMAGTAGTALHLALFMKPGDGHVIQIKRNTLNQDNATVQYDICNFKKLDFSYVAGSVEKQPTPHFTDIPQIVGVTPYMQKFFDDNNFKYNDKDIAMDEIAWNSYKKQLRKYNIKHCYCKIVNLIARVISVFGITRYGRQIIREFIMKVFYAC